MPKDPKYGFVALENKQNIPADEPVFVLRGQDHLAPGIVSEYAELYLDATEDLDGYERIKQQARDMYRWPTKKLPD